MILKQINKLTKLSTSKILSHKIKNRIKQFHMSHNKTKFFRKKL